MPEMKPQIEEKSQDQEPKAGIVLLDQIHELRHCLVRRILPWRERLLKNNYQDINNIEHTERAERPLLIACSAGRDSMCLLHAALKEHHQTWSDSCRSCRSWSAPRIIMRTAMVTTSMHEVVGCGMSFDGKL